MRNSHREKGFTLVELLVVIAIIGFLVGIVSLALGGARREARDDRRVADLRQAQQALQLYFLKCRMYPGDYEVGSKECLGGEEMGSPTTNSDHNPADWSKLTQELQDAKLGFGTIPNDPVPGRDYSYHVQLGAPGLTPKAQCYVLRTLFETSGHRALDDARELDVDDFSPGKILPAGCLDPTCKHLYPPVNANFCDDASEEYCLGNIECFFGN